MLTFRWKFGFDQIPRIVSHMEFLLQKAYFTVKEKQILLLTNKLSLSSVVTTYFFEICIYQRKWGILAVYYLIYYRLFGSTLCPLWLNNERRVMEIYLEYAWFSAEI